MSNIYFVVYELHVCTRTSWSFWINYANIYVIVSNILNKNIEW